MRRARRSCAAPRCPSGAAVRARSSPRCAATCSARRRASRAAVRCAGTSPCSCPSSAMPSTATDRATLLEAIRCALATIGAQRPAVVLLDDLQWSDDATLELLASLAAPLRDLPVLVVAAYRSDEVPRLHPLRRLRTDLRRDRLLRELTLEPLPPAETAELVERVLGQPVAPALADRLYRRTQGVPFFVEEVASVLLAQGRLQPGPGRGRHRRRRRRAAARRRSATPCCCGSRRSRPRRGRPRRRRPSPARASTSRRVAALGGAGGLDALLRQRAGGRARRGAGGVPPSARARGPVRRRALAPAPGRCTGSSPSCSRRGASAGSEVAAQWLAAREPERALRRAGRGDRRARGRARLPRRRARSPARRWSCGPTASAPRSGWPCSTGTPAAPSWRATRPTRRARCGSWPRRARAPPAGPWPRRSAGWPRSTSCRATASTRS